MKSIILGVILSLTPSLLTDPASIKAPFNFAFNTLLYTCINGGTAAIYLDWDRVVYVSCKQIKPPKRYPR